MPTATNQTLVPPLIVKSGVQDKAGTFAEDQHDNEDSSLHHESNHLADGEKSLKKRCIGDDQIESTKDKLDPNKKKKDDGGTDDFQWTEPTSPNINVDHAKGMDIKQKSEPKPKPQEGDQLKPDRDPHPQPSQSPLYDIEQPGPNDYLFGAAATTKIHPGNKKYRKLVDKCTVEFMLSDRRGRNLIVKTLVQNWRMQIPPGRFLKRNSQTKLWNDVGDEQAKEKTFQKLRDDNFLKKQFGKRSSSERMLWPMEEILEPGENDFLVGRGASLNDHPGNKKFRKLVENQRDVYCKSKDKSMVATTIVREWRAQDPPGRFLAKPNNTIFWHDLGDDKAYDRTREFLREIKNDTSLDKDAKTRKNSKSTTKSAAGARKAVGKAEKLEKHVTDAKAKK